MPKVVQLKNGEWARVPDNITPQRLAELTGEVPSTTPTRRAARSEAAVRADSRKSSGTFDDTARQAVKGFTMSFGDEIQGGLSAAINSAGNLFGMGNGKSFADEYRTERDTQRLLDHRASQNSPIMSTIGEIGGAVVNPVGTGARILKGGAGLARSAGLGRIANALGGASARVASTGTIGKAALAGANQGTLNAIGSADKAANIPSAMLNGALLGGATGGVMGGAVKFGGKAVNAIRDRAPAAAERIAYSKAGERIRQARSTAAATEADMAAANATGNNMLFMDVTPGTRADAAYYSRKPNLDASNELRAVSDDRLAARGERFTSQVENTINMPSTGKDSDALIENIVQARRAQGKADYAVGGAMDVPVKWSDDLDEFWAKAPADTRKTMLAARAEIEGRRGNPDDYIRLNPDGTQTVVPTLRSFDYMKRGFDSEIGAAKSAGDFAKVQRLQSELGQFKTLFAEANQNNEYAQLLLRQRTGFEREQAVAKGQSILSRITTGRQGAREVMKEITALKPHEVDETRTAIIDGLLGLDSKASPLNTFRTMLRNSKQREVMEFAFGGKDKLDEFTGYLNRELKSANADALVSGPQSATSAVMLAAEGADEQVGNIFQQILRGYVVAGPGGAIANGVRQVGQLSTGMGANAQEAYGKILASDGQGLAKGVYAAEKFYVNRTAREARRARRAAKGAQQVYTSLLGRE